MTLYIQTEHISYNLCFSFDDFNLCIYNFISKGYVSVSHCLCHLAILDFQFQTVYKFEGQVLVFVYENSGYYLS